MCTGCVLVEKEKGAFISIVRKYVGGASRGGLRWGWNDTQAHIHDSISSRILRLPGYNLVDSLL